MMLFPSCDMQQKVRVESSAFTFVIHIVFVSENSGGLLHIAHLEIEL